jgi:hypothetical protein
MPAERMPKPRAMVRPLEDMLASTPAFPCGRGESRQREDSGGHELMTFSHTVMSTFGSLIAPPLLPPRCRFATSQAVLRA